MSDDDSDFIGKEPCPECGSRDNLARYSDGHGYCFGCGHYEPADGEGETGGRSSATRREDLGLLEGEVRELKSRRISYDTCKLFGYKVARHPKMGMVQVAEYRDKQGRPVAQKLRTADKDFKFIGAPKEATLFGAHLWSKGKKLVITEGEIDALSVSQAQGNKWPVVSVPNGAQGAAKALKANMEYLAQFESIVLMFDNDDPGKDAAIECAQLFKPGRAFIAQLPLKDANEMLVAGRTEELIRAVFTAQEYRPDGLLTMADIADMLKEPAEWGLPWPWKELTDATYGRRPGEVYMLGAGTGIGKTDLFLQILDYTLDMGERCACYFLEQEPKETGKRIAGKRARKRFHVPDAGWTQEELDATVDALKDEPLWLYNSFGAADWEVIEARIEYLTHAHGVKHHFIDHLTALATAREESEKEALEFLMEAVAKQAKRLGIYVYLISHLTTPEKGSHEEGARVTIRQFKGSRAIGFWAHFMFGMERNQQAEDPLEKRLTYFRILKDRHTGQSTGEVIPMMFDVETGMYDVCPPDLLKQIEGGGGEPEFADETDQDF